jgi:predicted nucleic acid-binding protein
MNIKKSKIQKPKPRIYLDTSVPSAYYDNEKPERQDLTKEFWLKTNTCETHISELVKQELNQVENEVLKKRILKLIRNFVILKLTDEVEELAEEYIKENVIPEKFRSDAIHIAIATLNNIDLLISWNFKHLVNVKTKRIVNLVNAKNGYKEIEIISPPEF